MKWNKQTRGLWNVQWFGNGTRWAMNTCRCNFFVQNLSDRVAKAERGSKTLRDHMKIQTYAV